MVDPSSKNYSPYLGNFAQVTGDAIEKKEKLKELKPKPINIGTFLTRPYDNDFNKTI